jgi:hypothetical protein
MNRFTLPTPSRIWNKDDVKALYLELSNTPIVWKQYGSKLFGLINSAAIFLITLNEEMEIVVETWYPGQERVLSNWNIETLDNAKRLAEHYYRIWLKADFRKMLDALGE